MGSDSRVARVGRSLLAAGAILLAGAGPSSAQQPSAQQIIDALKSRGHTRGLIPPADAEQARSAREFIDSLRRKATRSITIEEREKVSVIAQGRPSIDLEVTFDYDSAVIGSQAMPTVIALGTALRSSELGGAVFVLAGHTDAKGSAGYNQDLSERRADAVKRFLVEKFSLSAENMVAVGYGKEQLKNGADPFGRENRRVQVVNMAGQ